VCEEQGCGPVGTARFIIYGSRSIISDNQCCGTVIVYCDSGSDFGNVKCFDSGFGSGSESGTGSRPYLAVEKKVQNLESWPLIVDFLLFFTFVGYRYRTISFGRTLMPYMLILIITTVPICQVVSQAPREDDLQSVTSQSSAADSDAASDRTDLSNGHHNPQKFTPGNLKPSSTNSSESSKSAQPAPANQSAALKSTPPEPVTAANEFDALFSSSAKTSSSRAALRRQATRQESSVASQEKGPRKEKAGKEERIDREEEKVVKAEKISQEARIVKAEKISPEAKVVKEEKNNLDAKTVAKAERIQPDAKIVKTERSNPEAKIVKEEKQEDEGTGRRTVSSRTAAKKATLGMAFAAMSPQPKSRSPSPPPPAAAGRTRTRSPVPAAAAPPRKVLSQRKAQSNNDPSPSSSNTGDPSLVPNKENPNPAKARRAAKPPVSRPPVQPPRPPSPPAADDLDLDFPKRVIPGAGAAAGAAAARTAVPSAFREMEWSHKVKKTMLWNRNYFFRFQFRFRFRLLKSYGSGVPTFDKLRFRLRFWLRFRPHIYYYVDHIKQINKKFWEKSYLFTYLP
jgi:hypothetical protein